MRLFLDTNDLRDRLAFPEHLVATALELQRSRAQLVEPSALPSPACRDPDDHPILGTALAPGAEALVTGDADLLELGEYRGIPILPLRSLLGLRSSAHGSGVKLPLAPSVLSPTRSPPL